MACLPPRNSAGHTKEWKALNLPPFFSLSVTDHPGATSRKRLHGRRAVRLSLLPCAAATAAGRMAASTGGGGGHMRVFLVRHLRATFVAIHAGEIRRGQERAWRAPTAIRAVMVILIRGHGHLRGKGATLVTKVIVNRHRLTSPVRAADRPRPWRRAWGRPPSG